MSFITNAIKNHPRRTVIIIVYIAVLFFTPRFNASWWALILALLGATALIILFSLPDCVAIIGNYLYGRGQADKAVPYYKWSIAHKTKSPAAHLYYATYLIRHGGAAEAAPLLEHSATLNPSVLLTKNIRLTQASCQWVLGNVDGAIEIIEKMRKTFEYVNASALSTLGYLYLLKDELEKAEEITMAAIKDSPESHAAWDNIGQIRFRQNDIAAAKEAMLKAVSYKENAPDSLYYLGLISRIEGDEEKAREYFSKAINCNITPLNTVTREQIEKELKYTASRHKQSLD